MCDKNNENIDQYWTSDDKAATAEMTLALVEQNIEREANKHSNELGGKEKPPLREVTINLKTDQQTYSANETFVHGPDNPVHIPT